MTATELHDTLEPLLDRHPFVPIRVDGEGGPITTISNPYRTDLFEGTLTVLHKDDGRPVARVKAEQVARLVPYDELPAEPGCLSFREFHAVARPLARATPFRPFRVELIDGRRFRIEQSGELLINGRFASAQDASKGPRFVFPVSTVAAVTVLQPAEVA